jgi:YD repeat-containing protein
MKHLRTLALDPLHGSVDRRIPYIKRERISSFLLLAGFVAPAFALEVIYSADVRGQHISNTSLGEVCAQSVTIENAFHSLNCAVDGWAYDIPGLPNTASCYELCPQGSRYPGRWRVSLVNHSCPTGPAGETVATLSGTTCTCNTNYTENPTATGCFLPAEERQEKTPASKPEPPKQCPVGFGNPIYPLTGTKRLRADTGITIGASALTLHYNTQKNKSAAAAGVAVKDFGDAPSFGPQWMSNLHKRLVLSNGQMGVQAFRGDGSVASFTYVAGAYTTDADVTDTLTIVSGALQLTSAAQAIETYNYAGQLQSSANPDGSTLIYTYSDASTPALVAPAPGYLIQVTDQTGRTVKFEYLTPVGGNIATDAMVSKVIDSAGHTITATYNTAANLSTLTWADGKVRQYVYENAALPWALTGVIDEKNVRYATYGYDAQGNATSTELAGGVDRYTASYATPPAVQFTQAVDPNTGYTVRTTSALAPSGAIVTKPNGQTTTLNSSAVLGVPRLVGMSQPAGSGCNASNSYSTFDANANLTSKDDFQGQRICYAYDAKNQEITRVEGLANTVACATVLPTNAVLPANARKTTTTYHPDWRLPATVTMPGTITTRIYHDQADPFNGNAAASCTSAPNLPGGKPSPVLCKQVVQATLPSGALDSTVANTTAQYTYNAAGKVLTATDTLNRTTTYTYYPSTAFTGTDPNAVGNTVGDLQSITNPAGFVTTFNSYDKTGRVLKTTDPKGIVTDMTYTPRGWVSTVATTAPSQSARTTTYTYDNVGQLTGVTNPDGSTLAYTYDAAHRLTGATDAKGNSVTYTLDNMGNRTKEDIKDPTGVLQRSIDRSFDALNRLQQVTGAVQ